MKTLEIVRAGESPENYTREQVGGKGLNLMRLFNHARASGLYNVPNFFIVPVEASYDSITGAESTVDFYSPEIRQAFDRLAKPVIARSSSPFEDGVNASFAGMFLSVPELREFNAFCQAFYKINNSTVRRRDIEAYAARRGVDFSREMAVISQEQDTQWTEKGVIQLEEDKAVIEQVGKKGRRYEGETDYGFLDESAPWEPYLEIQEYLCGGAYHYNTECARQAKKALGLEGVVQVEFCLAPGRLPVFVQIRQLPPVKSYAQALDLDVPEGASYIESEVCNGVAGELSLPAYSTLSASGLGALFANIKGCHDDFYEKSKLPANPDFASFRNIRLLGSDYFRLRNEYFTDSWRSGNSLFPSYVLVCDKLDQTVLSMDRATSNKKAIITWAKAEKTSHAMTVARELGIIGMGANQHFRDFSSFFHQVETGDMVHVKSNGKKAVAYIEKKREQ